MHATPGHVWMYAPRRGIFIHANRGVMRIVTDLNRCLGYAQCVPLAPEVLKLSGEEALARLEVNTAFEAFLRRVENPRLVEDPPPYRISQVFRGPGHLLVDYDAIRP